MNKLILATTVIAIAAAAQLPPSTYLPAGSGPNSGPPSSGPGNQHDASSKSINNGNTRPQQAAERSASILNFNNEADDNGFHYAYETSNGIQAEESGNAEQTRGGFAYKGDDGQIYSVTFTAGEDGFRPQGAHLPVPPPTPEEILLALKQNEKDEAAGIFDDGQYREDNNENRGKQGSSGNHQGSFNSNSGYTY